jgi:SOS response regulatory protein OraA/RecX
MRNPRPETLMLVRDLSSAELRARLRNRGVPEDYVQHFIARRADGRVATDVALILEGHADG